MERRNYTAHQKKHLTSAINTGNFPRCLSRADRYASTTQTPLQITGYCGRYAPKAAPEYYRGFRF